MKKGLKTNRLFFIVGLLLGVLFAFYISKATPVRASTGINQTINFQGRLLNSQGATVPDGFYNLQFKIYQDGDGQSAGDTTGSPAGSLKWTENYLNNNSQGVKVVNGFLSVQLGSVAAFGSNIDWNQSTLWLSMNIGGTGASCTPFSSCSPDGEMLPMQPLSSAPYAFNSGQLGGLTKTQFVQLAQGLQTDASNADTISINKTGSGNLLDLEKNSGSVFLVANSGATTITTTAANALLVRDATGTGYLSVDTSSGGVNIGVTGATVASSTIHIADSSAGVQIVTIGSTNSSSATTIKAGSGGITLSGDITVSSGKNFTQSGAGTFSTGTGNNTLNGDTTIASGKNFTQSGTGTFSTGSGTNTLNGDTTVAGTKNFTVNGGNTTLGANLDVSGSAALKKGADFSTTGTTNNASFANASLIRLTGASAQTITGIAGGRDGYTLTLVNAGTVTATLTNNDSNSSAANRITTGTGGSITLPVGSSITLVYDTTASLWRAGSSGGSTLQTAYNNSTSSPQITLSSANGGLVVQDASSAIGAALFTVQSNGGATKYFNVDASTVAITDNLTVSGTYNTNTFNSTSLQFGGASGTVSSSAGNLTIQAASTNSLILDTAGAGTVSLAAGNATNINVAGNNTAHNIHIGDGGTSTVQTITIGSSGAAASAVTINAGSGGGITLNGGLTINGSTTISGTNSFATGSGSVSLNGDTTIASGKNFTQSGAGTFSTGSGANSLNGDTTIASGKNFTQSGAGTFSTGSGTNTLNGDTTVAGTKNFTVNGGNTVLGANLDVTGSEALKKGTDFSTTGTTNNASFSNASLIRLTGASAQTITGIQSGRDGYILTLVNAGSAAATLTNNDSNSSAGNRITTGTGGNVTIPVGASISLVYDSTAAVWRAGSSGGSTLQAAYNNSSSPQITLSSANGGLVVQDAVSAIGADLFTVQSNGGATKYLNITATTVAINDNLTVSGTYNTNTFNSTSLQFGGASGTVSSGSGNLTIQAASTNSLLLDTGGNGTVGIATTNAGTVNVATNNVAHAIHIGDGGTSTAQTITIGSSGASASAVTINAGSSGGITLGSNTTINGNTTISGTNSFATGSGSVSLNGDTAIASGKNFTQSGAGTFSTGTGANTLNGNTTISGSNTFTTGTGAVALNGDTTIANDKAFTANGASLFKNHTDSTTSLQIQDAGGINLLQLDSTGDSNNLISNGSFEIDTSGWTAKNGSGTSTLTQVTAGTTAPYMGTGSMQVATTGADASNAGASYSRSFTNATQYAFTLFAKLNSGTFTTFQLGNSNNNSTDTSCLTAQTVVTGGWTRFSCTFTYTGSTGTSYVYFKQTNSTNQTYFIDDVKLEAASAATPYRESALAINGNITSPITFKNQSDSTHAFQIQNAAGTSNLFIADTLNGRIGIGKVPSAATLDVNGTITATGNLSSSGGQLSAAATVTQTIKYNTASATQGAITRLTANPAGVTINANDVVVMNTSFQGTTTTTERDMRVWGVSGSTVGPGSTAYEFTIYGNVTVNATGTVNIGDKLVTSTTAGRVKADNSATKGVLGIATSSLASGTGTVGVFIRPEAGTDTPIFKNASDSSTAFQVQNSSGRGLLAVDTSGSILTVGNATDGAQITLGATGNANSTVRKPMVVNGTISANDLVEIDTANAGQVKQAAVSSAKIFGVATSAVGSGSSQDIVISGVYQVNANTNGGTIAIGDELVSSSTAGQATKAGATTAADTVIGLALSTLSGGKVWVYINLGLGGSDNLQTVYNKSTGGTTPEVKLDSTRGGLDIQDADSTISGSLLTVRASNGSGLGSAILDVQSTGIISLGTTSQTATITVGQSTATNTISLGAAVGNGATQTVNIGNSTTSGSTTNTTVGSTVAGTTAINGASGISLTANTTVSAGQLLVVGTNSSDLTCTNGGIYYNTGTNRFKGCENGTWIYIDNFSDVQTYTSGDNTWNKPTNVNAIQVILVGGGGGAGGGGARNGGQERNGGGGGGGGAYASQIFAASDIGSTAHAAVGSAGSSGSGAASSGAAGSNGGAGGTSCFSSTASCGGTLYVSAFGGGGGGGGNQAGTAGGGGGGGGGTAAAGSTGSSSSNTGATGGNPAGGGANTNVAGGAGAGGGSGNAGTANAGNNGGAAEYGGAGGGGSAGGNSASGAGGSSLHGAGGGGSGGSTNSGNSTGAAGAGGVSQSNTSGGGGAAGAAGCTTGSGGGNGSSIKAGSGGGGGGANGGGGSTGCAGGAGGAPGGGGGGGGSGSVAAGAGGAGGAGEIWVISW